MAKPGRRSLNRSIPIKTIGMTSDDRLDLGSALHTALAPVFGGEPVFLSDSGELVAWLIAQGCQAFKFLAAESLSKPQRKNVVLAPTNGRTMPAYLHLRHLFGNARMLIIPLLAFDPSLDSAAYTLHLLSRSDFASASAANSQWLATFAQRTGAMLFRGAGCELECRMRDDLDVMKPMTEPLLRPGEWESIASYFEVGMILTPHDMEELQPGYEVHGALMVPGVVVAQHRQMPETLRSLPKRAWAMFRRLREEGAFPLQLVIENSRVVHASAGSKDITRELGELTNSKYELVLTEMAVSTNSGVMADSIDWSRNSQLNEGALGIHVGMGDGLTGAHIDFVCPGVEHAG